MFLGSYWILSMRFLAVLCITLATAVSFTIAADNKRCKRPLARAESCECEPTSAGLLKMSGGKLVVCDGSEWKTLQFEIPLGSSSDNPGYSCKHILDNGKQAADGVYWITLTCKFHWKRWLQHFWALIHVFKLTKDRSALREKPYQNSIVNLLSNWYQYRQVIKIKQDDKPNELPNSKNYQKNLVHTAIS